MKLKYIKPTITVTNITPMTMIAASSINDTNVVGLGVINNGTSEGSIIEGCSKEDDGAWGDLW